MHFLPWRFRSFLFSKVQVKPKSYSSRPGFKTTHFSLLMSSGVNTCGRTDSAPQMYGKTLPPAGQCSEGTWSINYVCGNLFFCPKDESLAHCISEDCRMGAGVAVTFKKKFGGVDDLKRQSKQVGQCAVLKRGGRFVYYLITKKKYNHKPTYANLKQSLEDMRSHCAVNAVSKVSMPRIGCGLDKLEWKKVSEILREVFEHSNISITVYSLPEKTQTTVMKENARQK